jgi:hypothetical protein
MAINDPDGQESLPACSLCTHAGEKHRGDHQASRLRCNACPNCPGYVPMTADFKQVPLTLGSLQGGRRPPEGPLG